MCIEVFKSIDLNNSKNAKDNDGDQGSVDPVNTAPNFINTFSSLIIDQLNTQDVSQLLQTQRQM